jgi:Mn-dependent DtxR family transcriptional regulator
MNYEHSILRALLRLARRRSIADSGRLLDRVGGTTAELRDALRRLETDGFVDRRAEDNIRLTLPGLAVAVASIAGRRKKTATPRTSRRAA